MKKKVRALLREILEIKDRKDDFDERKFLTLVDQTFDCMDLNIAKTLMKTFLEKQDYGTQERVISAILRGGRGPGRDAAPIPIQTQIPIQIPARAGGAGVTNAVVEAVQVAVAVRGPVVAEARAARPDSVRCQTD